MKKGKNGPCSINVIWNPFLKLRCILHHSSMFRQFCLFKFFIGNNQSKNEIIVGVKEASQLLPFCYSIFLLRVSDCNNKK